MAPASLVINTPRFWHSFLFSPIFLLGTFQKRFRGHLESIHSKTKSEMIFQLCLPKKRWWECEGFTPLTSNIEHHFFWKTGKFPNEISPAFASERRFAGAGAPRYVRPRYTCDPTSRSMELGGSRRDGSRTAAMCVVPALGTKLVSFQVSTSFWGFLGNSWKTWRNNERCHEHVTWW